jgi:Ca-activated chloride channel family protein
MKKSILIIGSFLVLAAITVVFALQDGVKGVNPVKHPNIWAVLHPTAPDPGPVVFASNNGNVQFEWKLGNPYLLKNGSGDVFLDLRVTGKALANKERKRMNVVLVIDRSGSMADENKLEQVKNAAAEIVNNMNAEDRLAVVIYDDSIQTLIPSGPVENKERIKEAIYNLEPGGSTNLCGGLRQGFEEARRNFKENYVNRIILLSDGLANAGITDPDQIDAEAKRIRANAITISTMGVGTDYNENLMANIADYSGGNYYYISKEIDMAAIFRKEWNLMQSVVATNAHASIDLAEGVDVTDVAGFKWEKHGNTLTVQVPDVYSGETKRVLVQLRASAGSIRTIALGSGRFDCTDVTAERTLPVHFAFEPSIKVIEDPQMVAKNLDRDVNMKVASVNASKQMDVAYQKLQAGDKAGAGTIAADAAEMLRSLGYVQAAPQAARYDEFAKTVNSPTAISEEQAKDILKKNKEAERKAEQSTPQ